MGAGIGTLIMPVVGTLIGGLLGAAVGGILGFIGGKNIAKSFDAFGALIKPITDGLFRRMLVHSYKYTPYYRYLYIDLIEDIQNSTNNSSSMSLIPANTNTTSSNYLYCYF